MIDKQIQDKIQSKKIALVLGGLANSLGVCRSLLKDDTIIIVSICANASPVRGLKKKILFIEEEKDLLKQLEEINEIVELAVCYSCGDQRLIMLCENKDLLNNFSIPFTDIAITNKADQLAICEKVKVPYPKSFAISGLEDYPKLEELSYPIMIKPSSYHHELFKAEIVNDELKRNELIKRCNTRGVDCIVAEYIPGGDETLLTYGGYAWKGKVLESFTGRKRSQHPPLRGQAAMAESYKIDGLKIYSEKFIKECNFSGIFQVEFKKHSENNIPYFIEFNPRNWLWGYTATLSNKNLPLFKYYKEAENKIYINGAQSYKHVFICTESIIRNFLRHKSFNSLFLAIQMRFTKSPYFAYVANFNLRPLLILFRLRWKNYGKY
jgi:predicted ATP-grasp superfamily ATP-dependent carboligase